MKRILMALMVASLLCSPALAQQTTTLLKDSIGKGKVTVTLTKSGKKSGSVTVSSADSDSTYAAEYTDTPDNSSYVEDDDQNADCSNGGNASELFDSFAEAGGKTAIAIVAITLGIVFSFPLFILFIAFYFRYRSRKARYKLAEQALAAGQPIPEGVFKETMNLDTRSNGIKNICLGAGLFIFLWAVTDSIAIGSVGVLILFTGLGQYLVARNQPPTDERK